MQNVLLVGMNGLNVLAKVVETGKVAITVAAKGALASVLSNVPSKMF